MKFAPVMPARLYPFFDTGDYHLVQAHLVLQYPEVVDWLCECAASHHTIILDNGVIERGTPSINSVIRLADTIYQRSYHPVTAIVCPDMYNDYQETIGLWKCYADTCSRYATYVMAVPHGQARDEYIECALEMARSEVHIADMMFGLPKVIDRLHNERWFVMEEIAKHLDMQYHLFHWLGVWNDMHYTCATARSYRHDGIGGFDTTLPVANALLERDIFSEHSPKDEIRGDMWNIDPSTISARAIILMHRNIAKVRRWISPAQ